MQALSRWKRGLFAMANPGREVHALQIQPAPRTSNDIVVLTANLWHDWPRRRRLPERMEAFAQMIEEEGVDVVLAQEVVRTSDQWFDRWLSERLGMSVVYTRANGHERSIGFEEGLAILTRYPMASSEVRRFEPRLSSFVNRLGLGAEIHTPLGDFWAFSVHLGLVPSHNAAQVSALQEWVGAVAGAGSAVVGGDFNSPEHTPQMMYTSQNWLDTYRHLHPHADAATFEVQTPWGTALWRNRLDYLFLRENQPNWQVMEARRVKHPHSDHQAVLTRLSPGRTSSGSIGS